MSAVDKMTAEQRRKHLELTRDEDLLARMIVEGTTDREIGDRLDVTDRWARVLVRSLCQKLEARNKIHLAAILGRWGF